MAQKEPERETFDYALRTTIKRYAPAYYKLTNGGYDEFVYAGTSIRPQGRNFLVIVRATTLVPLANVVVFGSGDTLADALRNASLAIGKNRWKPDKFAK